MPIFFNKVERGNPAKPSDPKMWYPVIKSTGLVKEKKVAKLMAEETALNPKDAELALTQLMKVVAQLLLDGHTVQLGELGSLRVTAQTVSANSRDEVTARNIKDVKIRFNVSDALREEMKKAVFTDLENRNK